MQQRQAGRAGILAAARRVAARKGASNLSLRGVAAEAGFAPAALYVYFRNKDELLLALAAEDLANIARALRHQHHGSGSAPLAAAAELVLDLLSESETLAAAPHALGGLEKADEQERLFNGRLISALTALSQALGQPAARSAQADTMLVAAVLIGLALLRRTGRLAALGFSTRALLGRLEVRFSGPVGARDP